MDWRFFAAPTPVQSAGLSVVAALGEDALVVLRVRLFRLAHQVYNRMHWSEWNCVPPPAPSVLRVFQLALGECGSAPSEVPALAPSELAAFVELVLLLSVGVV